METNKKYKEVPFKNFLGDYLHDECGIQNPKKLFHCLDDNHKDEHPSMSYNEARGTCHCWACGKTYNIVSLVMEREHKTYNEAIARLSELYKDRASETDFKSEDLEKINSYKKTPARDKITEELEKTYRENQNKIKDEKKLEKWESETIDYIKSRGFKNAQFIMRRSGIKKINDRIYIPHIHNSDGKYNEVCTDYISRTLDPNEKIRYMRQKGAETSLFSTIDILNPKFASLLNRFRSDTNNFIFITEGEFDALTIEDMYKRKLMEEEEKYQELKERGDYNSFKSFGDYVDYKYNIGIFSVGLSSTGNVDKFINQIKALPYEDKRRLIFIPLCDNDNAGSLTNQKLDNFFKKEHLNCINNIVFIDPSYKDINDFYKNDGEGCYQKFSDFINKSKTYADYIRGSLFEEKYNYLIDEFQGKKRIRFIQGTAYELTDDGDVLSKSSFNWNCIETRRFCFNKKDSKIIKEMKDIEVEMKENFYKKCGNNHNVRVVISTGTYWFDKVQTKNIRTCLGKLSTNKIYLNVAEWKENESNKYDKGLRNNMLISTYDKVGNKVDYKLFKGGHQTTEEEIIRLEKEREQTRNLGGDSNERRTSKIEND